MDRRQSLLAGLVLGISFGLRKIYPLQELDFGIGKEPQPGYAYFILDGVEHRFVLKSFQLTFPLDGLAGASFQFQNPK